MAERISKCFMPSEESRRLKKFIDFRELLSVQYKLPVSPSVPIPSIDQGTTVPELEMWTNGQWNKLHYVEVAGRSVLRYDNPEEWSVALYEAMYPMRHQILTRVRTSNQDLLHEAAMCGYYTDLHLSISWLSRVPPGKLGLAVQLILEEDAKDIQASKKTRMQFSESNADV
jgi:hypothetical protein